MRIIVNEEHRDVASSFLISDLAIEMNLPKTGSAIALNNAVVPRILWDQTELNENDQILVILAAQGG